MTAPTTNVATKQPNNSSRPENRDRFIASSSGWIASLLIHLIAVVTATVVILKPDAPVRETEVEVGIADHEIEGKIGTGTPELVLPLDQSRLVDLVNLAVESNLEVAPLSQTITSDTSRQFSALLTSQFSSRAGLALMDVDWGGVRDPFGGGTRDFASFFGLQANGGRFIYVIDASASMGGTKMDEAKAEAMRSIAALSPKQEFFIIFFNTTFRPMPAKDLVRATPNNLQLYLDWLKQVKSGGHTNPKDAMELALTLAPDVIYFLTDGVFHPSAVDVIRNANQGRQVQIFTVAYYLSEGLNSKGLGLLQQIADDNRGTCILVPPVEKTGQSNK